MIYSTPITSHDRRIDALNDRGQEIFNVAGKFPPIQLALVLAKQTLE